MIGAVAQGTAVGTSCTSAGPTAGPMDRPTPPQVVMESRGGRRPTGLRPARTVGSLAPLINIVQVAQTLEDIGQFHHLANTVRLFQSTQGYKWCDVVISHDNRKCVK